MHLYQHDPTDTNFPDTNANRNTNTDPTNSDTDAHAHVRDATAEHGRVVAHG